MVKDLTIEMVQNRRFMPAFRQIQAESKEGSTVPKVILLAGGLAGSGKTTHLEPLIGHLEETLGLPVKYYDKDRVLRMMPPGSTGQDAYKEMMARAGAADASVIIHEGNVIGNLTLFRDYICSQHALGATVICLDFQCSDARVQHARLVERAKVDPDAEQRDRKKLDLDYYLAIDRPGEIDRHDRELNSNCDLIRDGILHLEVIETATASIEENVDKIIKLISALDLKAEEKAVHRSGSISP
jgi:hypothetical protein